MVGLMGELEGSSPAWPPFHPGNAQESVKNDNAEPKHAASVRHLFDIGKISVGRINTRTSTFAVAADNSTDPAPP
jgi:hypothetical protein